MQKNRQFRAGGQIGARCGPVKDVPATEEAWLRPVKAEATPCFYGLWNSVIGRRPTTVIW